jgi:glycosyltransferase involved in cell wall biosynthesis
VRIAFFINTIPFNDRTIDERPLGGTETGVARLARALNGLGHEVTVLTADVNPPLSNPLYVSIDAVRDLGPVDAFIAIRDWKHLLAPIQAKRKLLWTGDSDEQPYSIGLGDRRVVEQTDLLLTVSTWQSQVLCERSGFPREKTFIMGNGVDLELFVGAEERVRKRLIYSSVPYRGLQLMPEILEALVERHPDLEFHSFGGFAVYDDRVHENDKRDHQALLERLSRFPQFHNHGNVTQRQLAREMMRSSILAYPNTFAETSCITALEAQAAGCAIVSSALGAMPESVGDAGILITDAPGSPEYTRNFVDAVDRLLSDDSAWARLSQAGLSRAEGFEWAAIAQRLSDLLEAGLVNL